MRRILYLAAQSLFKDSRSAESQALNAKNSIGVPGSGLGYPASSITAYLRDGLLQRGSAPGMPHPVGFFSARRNLPDVSAV